MALTRNQKSLLRAYWAGTYHGVQIRRDDSVWAKKAPNSSYGLLETPIQAVASVKALEEKRS